MNGISIKANSKQLRDGITTFSEVKSVFKQLGINSYDKLLLAQKNGQIKLPSVGSLKALCLIKTGKSFQEYFDFTVSSKKQDQTLRLLEENFINDLKLWCVNNNILSQMEYAEFKGRPSCYPSHTILTRYGGEDYFISKLGLEKYKRTFEDKILSSELINEIKNWCVANDITSVFEYAKASNCPKHFPSAERIRQLYGNDYFYDVIGFSKGYEYFTLETARRICQENNIFSSTSYSDFQQHFNNSSEIKLPSSVQRHYGLSWSTFINLTASQLFIGKHMSNLELYIYKLLYDRDITFETEKTFDDCRSTYLLRYDFYLPDFNALIELDGQQHFEMDTESLFYSATTAEHDKIKDNYAFVNNIRLYRIRKITDILPVLESELNLKQFPKVKDLDWTSDFDTEAQIINSNLSKTLKVKLLLLMAERGKSNLSNIDIIRIIGCKKSTFYATKNDLLSLKLINRENEYHYSQEEKDKIISLFKEGKKISEIMRQTGYGNRAYLIKYLKDSGINYHTKSLPTPEESLEKKKMVYSLFQNGIKQSQICVQLNLSSGFVSSAIKEMKIKNGDQNVSSEVIAIASKAKALLQSKRTWTEISEELGCSIQHLKTCIKLSILALQAHEDI